MTQKDIQLKDLTSMLQNLDSNLLQRATDYIRGLVDASSEQKHDWWNDLPDSIKQDIEEGLLDIEQGNLIPMEEVMKKYSA
jgi:predicted transcriptional regulator